MTVVTFVTNIFLLFTQLHRRIFCRVELIIHGGGGVGDFSHCLYLESLFLFRELISLHVFVLYVFLMVASPFLLLLSPSTLSPAPALFFFVSWLCLKITEWHL